MTTKKIVLIVVIIIVLSTAIIVTINLLKKKKIVEKNLRDRNGVDTTGMNDYVIIFPFIYQQKIGDYYDAIINTGYSHVSEKVTNDANGNQNIEVYIKALPKDVQNIATILYKLNKEIVVKEITTKKP